MADDICAICENPLGDDRVVASHAHSVHVDCLRLVLGHRENHRLFKCTHCGQEAEHPRGALWHELIASRLKCQFCGKDFMVGES
jgi:hypothetical protein